MGIIFKKNVHSYAKGGRGRFYKYFGLMIDTITDGCVVELYSLKHRKGQPLKPVRRVTFPKLYWAKVMLWDDERWRKFLSKFAVDRWGYGPGNFDVVNRGGRGPGSFKVLFNGFVE